MTEGEKKKMDVSSKSWKDLVNRSLAFEWLAPLDSLLLIAGLACVVNGARLICAPLGWIAAGATFGFLSWLAAGLEKNK